MKPLCNGDNRCFLHCIGMDMRPPLAGSIRYGFTAGGLDTAMPEKALPVFRIDAAYGLACHWYISDGIRSFKKRMRVYAERLYRAIRK